jgi:hypothetical protein
LNRFLKKDRIPETIALIALLGWIGFQASLVLFEMRAFWLDEWFIIANLKSHTSLELWGQLDHSQQFPRLYLQILKWVSEAGHYSYTALRLVPFLVYLISLPLAWWVANFLFPDARWKVWTTFLLFLSYPTALHYSIQVKAYTMEMLAGIAALAQYGLWFRFLRSGKINGWILALSLMGALLLPFLSYSYPMALAPLLVHLVWTSRSRKAAMGLLALHLAGLAGAWFSDIHQVLADTTMKSYWADKMFRAWDPESWKRLFPNLFDFLRVAGNGYAVQVVLGLLLLAGIFRCLKIKRFSEVFLLDGPNPRPFAFMAQGLGVAVLFFLMGKYPLGESRLNCIWAFSFAALAVHGLGWLEKLKISSWLIPSLLGLLSLNAVVNFYMAGVEKVTGKDADTYDLKAYQNIKMGLELAYRENLPVLCLPNLASRRFQEAHPETDWIVRTNPAYIVEKPLILIPLTDPLSWKKVLHGQKVRKAVWLSGEEVKVVDAE